jgi:hypothetical protein
MQLTDNNTYIADCHGLPQGNGPDRTDELKESTSGRLLVLLSSCLLLAGECAVLDTITQASLASLQTVLEICHFGLVAYQIFGS